MSNHCNMNITIVPLLGCSPTFFWMVFHNTPPCSCYIPYSGWCLSPIINHYEPSMFGWWTHLNQPFRYGYDRLWHIPIRSHRSRLSAWPRSQSRSLTLGQSLRTVAWLNNHGAKAAAKRHTETTRTAGKWTILSVFSLTTNFEKNHG